MSSDKTVGLFGGSFDPPHWGHFLIAQKAQEALGLDQIIFIPCYQSPLKSGGAHASGDDRKRMLELATDALSWAEISDLELEREGPSYAIDTVREIKSRMAGTHLYWIMGADQWNLLEEWREYEALVENLTFIVYPREGEVVSRPGVRMEPIHVRFDISSTEIRERLAQRKDIHCFTTPAVVDYIKEHQLYRG